MIYEVEIPGALPTQLNDSRGGSLKRLKLRIETVHRVIDELKDAPHFPGSVYVGFAWIRPDSRNTLDDVGYSKPFIIEALRTEGVIGENALCFSTDLGFRVNARDPRTKVIVASSEDELLAAFAGDGVAYA